MIKKQKYHSPKILAKKISVNFFRTKNNFNLVEGFYSDILMAGSCVGCDCFIGGTKILLEDNKTKDIQDIKKGEYIVTFNIKNNSSNSCPVSEKVKFTNVDKGYIIINEKLRITGNHRLWVNNLVWKRADEVQLGDTLINNYNKKIIVKKLEIVDGKFDTYLLRLSNNFHTLFADNILVHE